jgi:leader peptidase (prepilin peptidase) / N-methyltransferase
MATAGLDLTSVPDALLGVFVVGTLAALSWYDLRERIIPNRIVLPAWVCVLTLQLVFHTGRWTEWLAASAIATLAFLIPALAYPGAIGMGDVKLAGLIGAALGYSVLTGLLLGTVLAGIFAALLLLYRGSSARRQALPYGPFLAGGAVIVLFL